MGSVVVTVIDNDYPGDPITASPERFGPWSETGTGTTGQRNTITLSVSPDTIAEDAGATQATVTATLTAALAADTVVILTLGGTAAAPADYSATSLASVTIPRGQTSAEGTLTITPVEDETAEGDETIEVTGSFKRFTVSPDTITLTDSDSATVGISGPTGEVAEGENAAFTVTLSAAIAKEVTVPWSAPLATDTAVAADLGATSGTVTFAAGSAAGATQTISIPITDDTTLEPAETFTVTLGAVGGDLAGLVTADPASATATIAKDASFGAHITLSFDPEYVQEGADFVVTLTATRDGTEGDHLVDWSVATVTQQTATNSTDFTKGGGGSCDNRPGADYFMRTLPSDVRIAPGETSASTTVTFHICADELDEPNETIAYTATAPGATFTEAVLTIGDPETITLSVSPTTVAEDAGATDVTVTATLSAARATDTVVALTLGGTAADPADYTVTGPTSITIPKGETAGTTTLTITPVDDALQEGDETITVSGASGARTVSSAEITLTNVTPPAPVISFETAPTSVEEGQTASYIVKLEGGRTTNVTVRFKTGADGDLTTAGQDYTAVDQTLTFTPTDTTKTVTVSTISDQRFEVSEDFTVTLSDAQGGGGLTPEIRKGKRTTTITDAFTDNDAYPESYTLEATPTSVGEGDGATVITFTATLHDEGTFPHPVDVIVYVEGKAGQRGTADLNEDYTVAGSHGEFLIFSIDPREDSGAGTLTLTPEDDSVTEGEETIVFTSAAGGGMTASDDTPIVTLADNDMATSITLSVSPSVLREGSSDQTTDVTVTATLDSDATLSVPIEVTVSLEDGTAKGEDYSKATATVIIPEGETSGSGSLKVTVTGDDKDEPDETLNVTGTAKGFTVHPAELTILDDDSGRRGNNIRLTVSPSRVREDAGATVLSVTASLYGKDALKQDAVINLSLADGTATLAGGDYSAATGTLTILAGQLSGTADFTFTPTEDAVVEGDETVLLNGALADVTVLPATVTIINSSHADLRISGPSAAVAEGSTATFTVTLSAAIAEELSVAWLARPNTAVAADYSPSNGSVTFPTGSAAGATRTFTVTMTDDDLSETLENFTVELGTVTSPVSAFVAPKSGSFVADAYIAESDPITVTLTGPSTVDEGDATTVYTVSLSPAGVTPTADLTVDYSSEDGTAEAGTDYDSASGTLTFTQADHADKTFTVQTTEDTLDESDETFTVTLDDPTGGGGPASSKHATDYTVTTTITDDDAATGITLSVDPDTLEEDSETAETVTVTATLNGGTRTEATVVTIGTLEGTATKDTDYTLTTALASITIPANSTSGTGTITITPIDDKVVEANETIIIPGTTTTEVGLTVSSATITLKDHNGTTSEDPNDEDKTDLSIAGPASNVTEGSNATFTVTLSAGVASQVTVAWSAPLAADAAEGADLSDTSGTVTFAANSAAGATQDITITATDDMLSEGAESFTVTLGTITTTLPATQVLLKSDDSSATATISASDPITVNISGPTSVDEGDATTDYTVSLSPAE